VKYALLVFAALAALFSAYTALRMSEMEHTKIIVQSITTTVETPHGKAPITTHRYEGESVEEWLAEHERALYRASESPR
jgi:hypothetical protein